MKHLFLAVIATGLIFATSCKKEEMQTPPTQGLNQEPVFSYDNTSVEGVFDAANFKHDNNAKDQVIPHAGYFTSENPDGSYNCAPGPLCWIEVRAKKNKEQKDLVFLVAQEKPIVKEGRVRIISEQNGYTVFTIN